jgi:hypothetical protein
MSIKLTDTQLVVLSAAAQREDRSLAIPNSLKGAPAQKVASKVLAEGLVREIKSKPGMPVWRRNEETVGKRLLEDLSEDAIGRANETTEPAVEPVDLEMSETPAQPPTKAALETAEDSLEPAVPDRVTSQETARPPIYADRPVFADVGLTLNRGEFAADSYRFADVGIVALPDRNRFYDPNYLDSLRGMVDYVVALERSIEFGEGILVTVSERTGVPFE